jgi:hypothetical protein
VHELALADRTRERVLEQHEKLAGAFAVGVAPKERDAALATFSERIGRLLSQAQYRVYNELLSARVTTALMESR